MKYSTLKTLLAIGLFALSFTACKKDQTASTNDEVTATDNQIADEASTDAVDQLNMVIMNEITVQSTSSAQVNTTTTLADADRRRTSGTVTISPIGTTYPKTITIDFGTGSTDNNGIVRKGKIVGVLTGPWWISGSTLTITFTDFYRNDNKIEGTVVLTSNGFNTDKTSYSYNVVVDKNRINADGKTITWSSNRTITYFNNGTPLTHLDDYFTISGTASGTNRNGEAFTTTITKELKKFVTYRWFVSGTIEHKVGAKAVVTLDYGDGTKDNLATISVSEKSKIITLK